MQSATLTRPDETQTPARTPTPPWHQLNIAQCAAQLKTDPVSGLSQIEAKHRLTRHGPNQLAEKKPRPAWLKFFDQFKNVLVLLGAVVLAAAIGDIKGAVVILIVVVFNFALGFYQEHRAEATLAALQKMLAQHAGRGRSRQRAHGPVTSTSSATSTGVYKRANG